LNQTDRRGERGGHGEGAEVLAQRSRRRNIKIVDGVDGEALCAGAASSTRRVVVRVLGRSPCSPRQSVAIEWSRRSRGQRSWTDEDLWPLEPAVHPAFSDL